MPESPPVPAPASVQTPPPTHRLKITRAGSAVPLCLWKPPGTVRALVLACHGGSGHKESGAILAMVRALLPQGMAVLAIDGPMHGERRADGNLDPDVARQGFRQAWRAGVDLGSMAEDFVAALDWAQEQAGLAGPPVGYIGVSMGTACGLPLLVREPRIRAAAIGLWGSSYPRSEPLMHMARELRCPLWFTQQWDDEIFDRAGTAEMFDAIGSPDKRLVAYPGGHRELEGERLADAVSFLAGRLCPPPSIPAGQIDDVAQRL